MTKRYILHLNVLLVILTGFVCSARAQKDTTRLNQEVEVVKAYRPSVSGAQKINVMPDINDTTRFRPDLDYRIISHPVTNGFKPSDLKASGQFQRDISFPGFGKINGGYGTALSPFFDLYLSNPNSKNGTLGLQLNHLSSMGKIHLKGGDEIGAPFSTNRAAVFGSYVINGVTISSELNFQRDRNNFYGYPVAIPSSIATNTFAKYFNADIIDQEGNFDLKVMSNASSSSDLKFRTRLNLGYFNTSFSQAEKVSRVNGDFSYNYGTLTGKLSAGFEHFETENVTELPDLAILSSPNSSWIQVSPSVLYQSDYLALEGGVNLYAVFGSEEGTTFKPYPKALLTLHTAGNNFSFYAGMDGYLQNNTLSGIAAENRYINPALAVQPTSNSSIFSGGVKGKIAIPLAFNFGVKYTRADDQYFYVTRVENKSGKIAPALSDLTYNNAFEVVYDQFGSLDISGDLSYTSPKLLLLLSGHFYSYQLTSLEKAPYRPDFSLLGTSDFKVTDKITGLAEFNLTGPRNIMLKFYLPPVASSLPPAPIYLKTDPMVDVNIGARYLFAKNLEFTGKIENVLNRKDEPWYGYTVQGIRFKLGASISF